MNEHLLKNINLGFVYDAEPIINWNFKSVTGDCAIYYKDFKNSRGFYFVSVEIVSYPSDQKPWTGETNVKILYHGIAHFDGIRHLYMGDEQTDNHGYDCYPSIGNHIAILIGLDELQEKYCWGD